LDITDREIFKLVLGDVLGCLNRAIFLQKIGLLETAEFVLRDNVIIGGKNV